MLALGAFRHSGCHFHSNLEYGQKSVGVSEFFVLITYIEWKTQCHSTGNQAQ